MRVITEWFSIESEQFVFGGIPNESMPAVAKDAITACREWLGMHEGEARIALSAKPPPSAGLYGMSHLRILFSTPHGSTNKHLILFCIVTDFLPW
jgi:hypothetical protein